jgi:hypothetical protein
VTRGLAAALFRFFMTANAKKVRISEAVAKPLSKPLKKIIVAIA